MRHLKYLGVLLILLVPALLFSAGAESGSCGPDLRWDLDDSGRLTVSGTGPMDDFGAKEAPWGTEITSAVLEDGVTSVGGYAFYHCKSLAVLSLPEGITSIGRAAFLGYVLNSADFDGGYGYGYGAYGKYARYGKYSRYGRYSSYGSYSKYGRYSRYGRYGSYSRYDSYSRYGSYSSTKKRKRKN